MLVSSLVALAVVAGTAAVLVVGRRRHDRHVSAISSRIESAERISAERREIDASLPPVARRFFAHALSGESVLPGSVRLAMKGHIGLRPGAEKMPFTAEQVISRLGFVWAAQVGTGVVRFSGDDTWFGGRGDMAWYLAGVVPVVRASGPDVSRSAAGRLALELAVMLPPALHPVTGTSWHQLDEETARVSMEIGEELLEPLLTIDPDGALRRIEMDRWDADAGDGVPGFVRWKAELDQDETFDGVTIPTRMRVVKRWGTAAADEFFDAEVVSARFTSSG